ncbi:MAG: hypothetical protein FJZ97_11190 [Chloroflexi bacterium]|nr:hypothetical protein [Chloroflexota bacterium]
MTTLIAAYVFAFTTVISVLFQVALALGAPWGHLAMGGRFPGKYSPAMRVAALVQAVVLALLAVIVTIKARLALGVFYTFSETATWAVFAISVLSLVMNLATPSRRERMLWAPVALVMALSSLVVALS